MEKICEIKKETLTKSQERIDKFGECFTPPRVVNEMLNRIPEKDWKNSKIKICDPTCGNGNFLVEVVKRKIEAGISPFDTTNTTFGVDIMKDNVTQCHQRVIEIIKQYVSGEDLKKCIENIVRNIRCFDALKYDFKFKEFKNKNNFDIYVNSLCESNKII